MAECDGKYKFKTLRAAEKATFHLWASDPRLKIGDLRAYKCPRCDAFHVGHWEYYEKKKRKNKMTTLFQEKQPREEAAPNEQLAFVPENTISAQLGNLKKQRVELEVAIRQLSDRLESVLTPVLPTNGNPPVISKAPECSQIVLELIDERYSLETLTIWIENLINRVEI